ncbi:MAG: PQQ-binding-like beta-propeller repeat protein [Gemmataceae bacterium]
MPSLLRLAAVLCLAAPLHAADWPHWLGPKRDGSSPETGLLTTWPKDGPKVIWKKPGGDGYSTVAVAGGKAITLVQRDAEYAVAFDAAKGNELWATKIGPGFKNMFGNGPRATPTIDGERVYVQSVTGNLACLNAKDGAVVWEKNILKLFGAKNITWGLSASPVVDGDLVYAIPGAMGAGVAAFDKKSGEVAWKSSNDKAAYASPQPITTGGMKQVLFFTGTGLLAVDAKKGEEAWSMPWETEFDCNIATPLVVGDKVFVSSGEEVGCALFKLEGASRPTEVWRFKGKKSPLTTYWATAVHRDGYLYGVSGEFNKRLDLNCVELKTGKVMWTKSDFGKAAITLADGHLFLSTKKGDLLLVEATPEKYVEKARVEGFLGENRTAPTIAEGRLYLRDKVNVYCLDIRGK